MKFSSFRRRRNSESGYILLIFLIVLTIMMIGLSAAAPRLAQQIQRDREIEMVHRGEQYERAIKAYYKKFSRYPSRIEDLENTNDLRFLRKRYTDPITGGPWRLVRYGEISLTPGGAGVGIPAQALASGAQTSGLATGSAAGTTSGIGFTNFSLSGSSGQQAPGTAAGSTATGTTTGDDSSDAATAASGTTASSGSSSSSSLFSAPAGTAQPGGAPIIGVASLSKKKGIHEFNKKSAYKDWLFIYDPSQDRGQLLRGPYNPQAFVGQANTPTGATPAGQMSSSPNQGSTSMFGNSSSTFGTSSSFGSSFGSSSSTSGSTSSTSDTSSSGSGTGQSSGSSSQGSQ